ncbi:MAG: M6 family metalloprotease domain-containing protein [Muribaculaceae bacterium]|nr:M6 family metalloprotease domain-containing protein [Muribaculaceae bacterium]
MKQKRRYHHLLPLVLGMLTFPVYSIPAKPGLIDVKNGNGETIKVRLVGDERFHFYFSEDGYPLLEKKEGFTYCRFTPSGRIEDSGIKAVAPEKRDGAARSWLRNVDRNSIEVRFMAYQESMSGIMKRSSRSSNASSMGVKSANETVTPYPQGPGTCPGTTFPAYGAQKSLVVLVEFKDVRFRVDNPKEYFHDMLNSPGFSEYGATGSARDYFMESSNGIFTPDFDVVGPVQLPHNLEYYGGNDLNGNDVRPAQMVAEACTLLDGEVDFSLYDRDGDRVVDNVYVYYAGLSEASGGGPECIWPHAWNVSEGTVSPVLDGVKIDRYACSNEWTDESPCGIGTFVHEFSHVLGLPDLYSTSYTGAFTPGAWSAMDVGPYNNDGRTPPLFSAFERYALGWIDPVEIKDSRNVVLPDISHNVAGLIKTDLPNEYFILENRQQKGWDKFIPGHGMLIWHIDYQPDVWTGNHVNNLPYHQYIDIEEADGMASYDNIGGDAFPGESGITSFTDQTVPSMKTWKGLSLGLPLTDITEDSEGIIRFKVKGGGESLPDARNLNAENVKADSFTAAWEPGEGDYEYLLSVGIPGEGDAVSWLPEYRYRNIGKQSSFQVDGLSEKTEYLFTVVATDRLDYSHEVYSNSVITKERTLEYEKVIADEASDISSDSFTAHWQPTEGATEYLLSVYTKKGGDPMETLCGFDGGAEELPSGWTSTSRQSYSMASYCGESAPSLRMAQKDDFLATSEYDDRLHYFSFWHRGNSTSEGDALEISCYDGEKWTVIESVDILTEKGGTTTTIDKLPDDAVAIRILFDRKGEKGSVAIDDIVLGHGEILMPDWLEGFENKQVGNVLQFKVSALKPETAYYYKVVASDSKYRSESSEEIMVSTLSESKVGLIEGEKGLRIEGDMIIASGNEEIFIYDTLGLLLNRGRGAVTIPGKGVRIIKVPSLGKTGKVRL